MSRHTDLEGAAEFAPILWMATDERLYPMLPHAFAFDGIDNDDDGLIDLEDPEEVAMDALDVTSLNETVEQLRGFRITVPIEAPDDVEPGAISENLRHGLRLKGVPVSEVATIRSIGGGEETRERESESHGGRGEGKADPRRFWINNYVELKEMKLPEDYLRAGPVDSSLREVLLHAGFYFPDSATMEQAGEGFLIRPAGDPTGCHVYYILRRNGDKYTIYNRILFLAERVDSNGGGSYGNLVVDNPNKLPKPRVVYHVSKPSKESDTRELRDLEMAIHEYWLYYLFDVGEGGHKHDSEHVFTFVDKLRETAGVVASGHTGASANNILVKGRVARPDIQLPQALPKHMPILVELGKHASAPDRNFNGQFDVGMDANVVYNDVWGSRDVMAATGVRRLRHMSSEFSFPRDPSTLIFEKEWRRIWIEGSRVGLTDMDRSNMAKFNPKQVVSKYGKGYGYYVLFPMSDMEKLVERLGRPNANRETIQTWLNGHKGCFWEDRSDSVRISGPAFDKMKRWATDKEFKDSKVHMWLHHDHRNPSDIFKSWLFPRAVVMTSFYFQSAEWIVRTGLQVADVKVPLLGRQLKVSTLELYVDFDISTLEIQPWELDLDLEETGLHDVGLLLNLFRGSHHGWYLGIARAGGTKERGHLAATMGLVPLSWDLKSIPGIGSALPRAQAALRTGFRGEIHTAEKPWNIDPLQFQIGLSIGAPRLVGPAHPLSQLDD